MDKTLSKLFAPFEREVNPYPIAFFRIVFFSALAIHFFPSLLYFDDNYSVEVFRTDEWNHFLYSQFQSIPSWVLRGLSITTMLACLASIIGFYTRISTILSALGFYLFASLNGLHIQTLAIVNAWSILSVWALWGGGARVWSVDAYLANNTRSDESPKESGMLPSLILSQVLLAFFFAGVEKVIAGWPFSNEMYTLLSYPKGFLVRDWVVGTAILHNPTVTSFFSYFTVFVELLCPILLLARPTRLVAFCFYQLLFFGIILMLEVPPLFYFMFAGGAVLALQDNELMIISKLVSTVRQKIGTGNK